MTTTPEDVVTFWREAGPVRWFEKSKAFDDEFRRRFLAAHEDAAAERLASWAHTPDGALALLILLDQFPRNSFRGTPRMYATDPLARRYADAAIAAGFDARVDPAMRFFFFLPFAHSEDPADQERSVALHAAIGADQHATRHRGIVLRFGRFPHRNAILGRESTEEERRFLEEGGFAG